jgi:signal transduction histidine kinase
VWPRLFSNEQFAEQIRFDRFWTGAFTGIFLAISLHCLMVWLGTRDQDFLNSCLFILGLGLLQSNLAGVLHEYLLYDSPWLMALSRPLLPALAFLAYIRFSDHFLNLPHFCPRAHRAFRTANWLIYLQLPVFLLWGNAVSMPFIMLLGALLILAGLIAGFTAWSRGFRPARFYLFANALLFGGGMIYILTAFNLMPATHEALHAFHAGTLGEAILIAFSLSDKINTLQKDRARAQGERLAAEKKVIQTLRESEALLEDRVRERTEQLEAALQLQNEQASALQAGNQKLHNLNEDMNAYMSVAAHDLKNPTSAIIGFIDLLIERWESWDTAKKLDKLGKIREMATHIHAIISKLLDINAIESGQILQTGESTDLAEHGARVASQYAEALDRKNLRLELHCPGPVCVAMDRDALLQILDNLVSNAIKYSPPGKQISLKMGAQGRHALIRVCDEGPGISADEQEKLFRKFAKLSARPTAGENSTGLGLYIVKKLVESYGGQIRCESRLGEGACFVVSLPLANDDIPA